MPDPDSRAPAHAARNQEPGIRLAEPPLEIPLLAVAGERDPLVTPERMEGWREHSTNFTFIRRECGHMAIDEDAAFLLDLIHGA